MDGLCLRVLLRASVMPCVIPNVLSKKHYKNIENRRKSRTKINFYILEAVKNEGPADKSPLWETTIHP